MAAGAVSAAVITTPAVDSVARGAEHAAEALEAGAQAAVEQDQAKRHRADDIGRSTSSKMMPPGPILAGQHANEQEGEQQRGAEPQRDQARHDAEQHQQRGQQQRQADRVERLHRRSLPNFLLAAGRKAMINRGRRQVNAKAARRSDSGFRRGPSKPDLVAALEREDLARFVG